MFNIYLIIVVSVLASYSISCHSASTHASQKEQKKLEIGDTLDLYNRVVIYYNGKDYTHSQGKNYAEDGYYYGQKGQCVEFVKRYYYEAMLHRMPNVWGNAIDFYNSKLSDGTLNKDRDLMQFNDGSSTKPTYNDLIVFPITKYGHVAIVSSVKGNEVNIRQQNMGYTSRDKAQLVEENGTYSVIYKGVKARGWLRKE